MAELKKADLGKRGNEETLVDKFYSLNNLTNIFLHKDGKFKPYAIVVVQDDIEHPYEADEKNTRNELLARVREVLDRANNKDKILFVGKFENTNQIKTVPLTEMVKTEEFGGQVGGKKINLGIKFEKDFYHSLVCELGCSGEKTIYSKEVKHLVEEIGKTQGCEHSQDKPRPVRYLQNHPLAMPCLLAEFSPRFQ